MQINFQLSLDDYRAAQRLHAMRSLWSRIVRALTLYIYPAVGLIFLALSLSLIAAKESEKSISTMIICGFVLVLCPVYLRFQSQRCYKRTRSGSNGCELTLDEGGIGVEGQYSSGHMDWKAIHSFREDEKVFLLYLAPARFIAIPKRAGTEEQATELRSLLSRQVGPLIDSER